MSDPKSEDRALAEAFVGGAVSMLIVAITIGGIILTGMAFS